jgi:hypothetical protein
VLQRVCPGFVELFPRRVPVELTEPRRGLLELMGAVNPILGCCFGECVLEDACPEVVEVDADHSVTSPSTSRDAVIGSSLHKINHACRPCVWARCTALDA